MKKFLICFLLTLFFAPFHIFAQQIVIDSGVNLIISEKGQSYIKQNLFSMIEENIGISPNYIERNDLKYSIDLPFKMNQKDSQGNDIKEFVGLLTSNLSSFFDFYANEEKTNLSFGSILFEANWDKLDFRFFDKDKHDPNYMFTVNLTVQASNISLGCSDIKARNDFIGDLEVKNKLELHTKSESVPLRLNLQLDIFYDEMLGTTTKVSDVSVNFEQILLGMNIDKDLDFSFNVPEVIVPYKGKELIILTNKSVEAHDNAYVIEAKQTSDKLKKLGNKIIKEKVTDWVKSGSDDFKKTIKTKLQANFDAQASSYIENLISKSLKKGYKESSESPPVGSEDEIVENLKWSIFFKNVSLENKSLVVRFDSFFEDLSSEKVLAPDFDFPYSSDGSKLSQDTFEVIREYDLSLSFDLEFFNQIIYISYERGFLKEFDLSEDNSGEELVKLKKAPLLFIDEESGKLAMDISMKYPMNGVEGEKYTKDEVEVDMNLYVKFVYDEEEMQYTLVLDGVDEETIEFNKKTSFKWWVKVLNGVRLVDANKRGRKSVTGIIDEMVLGSHLLSEGVPIPNDLGFLGVEHKGVILDRSGCLVFYTDLR